MECTSCNWNIFLSCVNCLNGRQLEIKLIREHVLCDGSLKSYIKWILHGEFVDVTSLSDYEYSNIHYEERRGHDS